jgi:hypothetical protein
MLSRTATIHTFEEGSTMAIENTPAPDDAREIKQEIWRILFDIARDYESGDGVRRAAISSMLKELNLRFSAWQQVARGGCAGAVDGSELSIRFRWDP